jgi:predicted ribosomally synthesized peptide with nif11-like leader
MASSLRSRKAFTTRERLYFGSTSRRWRTSGIREREDVMSLVMARALVTRLKDDEAFRKAVRALDRADAWRLVESEGFCCTAEEVREAHDRFG